LSEKGGGRASEHEKACGPSGTVRENSEQRKQIRRLLNFVDDDKSFPILQRDDRVGEARQVLRRLEIEMDGGSSEPPPDRASPDESCALTGRNSRVIIRSKLLGAQ
jgi:hypothetical protein